MVFKGAYTHIDAGNLSSIKETFFFHITNSFAGNYQISRKYLLFFFFPHHKFFCRELSNIKENILSFPHHKFFCRNLSNIKKTSSLPHHRFSCRMLSNIKKIMMVTIVSFPLQKNYQKLCIACYIWDCTEIIWSSVLLVIYCLSIGKLESQWKHTG